MSGWADAYIAKLAAGETVQFRPRGDSMSPRIKSGALCTVAPASMPDADVGDVVLCRVNGKQYLHLVTAVQPWRIQISNNKGHVNGWTATVYGRLVSVSE